MISTSMPCQMFSMDKFITNITIDMFVDRRKIRMRFFVPVKERLIRKGSFTTLNRTGILFFGHQAIVTHLFYFHYYNTDFDLNYKVNFIQ